MGCAGEVERCNLQVAPVDVALVKRHVVVDGDGLRCAAAHVVVFAMDACAAAGVYLGEIRRAVLGIVADGPDTGAGLHSGLVAGGIIGRDEVGDVIHREHGVLVECIGLVAGDFLSILLQEGKTTNHHHLSGDGASGSCTVLHSFRSFIIPVQFSEVKLRSLTEIILPSRAEFNCEISSFFTTKSFSHMFSRIFEIKSLYQLCLLEKSCLSNCSTYRNRVYYHIYHEL